MMKINEERSQVDRRATDELVMLTKDNAGSSPIPALARLKARGRGK